MHHLEMYSHKEKGTKIYMVGVSTATKGLPKTIRNVTESNYIIL